MLTTDTSSNQNEFLGKSNYNGFNPFLFVLLPDWIAGWWGLLIIPAVLIFIFRLFSFKQKPGQESRPIKPRSQEENPRTRLKINGSPLEYSSNKPMEKAEEEFVQKVQQIIEKQLTNPQFSIQDLSRQIGMSHSQLHRKLRAITGLPASKLIKSIKISKAKTLLLNPELTITAVAYDSGFNDPDYFHRVFKKEVGLTPTQYRESVI